MADNYTDSIDDYFLQVLEQDLGAPSKKVQEWRAAWEKKPTTYTDKANYMQAIYNAAAKLSNIDKVALANAAGEWAQSYNPDLVHLDGTPYTLTEFKTAIQNEGLTKDKSINTDRDALGKTIAASLGDDLTTADITAGAKSIMEGSAAKPYDPSEVSYLYRNAVGPDAVSPTDTVESLTTKYGNLKTATGKPLFTPAEIKNAVAGSSTAKQAFNTKVRNLVDTAVTKNSDLVKGSKSYAEAANKLLADAPTLESTFNTKVSGLTKNADGLWETGKSGVVTSDPTGASGTSGTYDYTGGIGQLSTNGTIDPVKMANMVNSYDTQKGVWSLPSINKDTGLFEANTSPYGQILTNSLNNYLSKGDYYSPTYVNSLASKQPAAMSSEGIAALKGEFTDLGTSKDLLNLANSAGMDYDTANAPGGITADSKLSPTLLKAYQLPTTANTTNTSSAGSQTTGQAKPGVPNLTGARSTAPVTALPSTTPGLITGPTIKTKEQADAEKAIADAKLKAEQEALAKKNAEALKLNQPWYKAGFISPEEYSAAIAAGFSTKADYNNYLKNAKTASSYADIQKANAYDVKAAPAQVNYIQAAGDNAAKYARSQDIAAIQAEWNSPNDAAKWIVANPNDPYAQLLKSQGYLDTPQIIDRSGVSTPQTTAPAQVNQGIAAGTSNFTNPDNMNVASGGIYNALPANTAGQVQQPATELPAEVVNQASTQANYYTANPGESQRVAAIQNSWTSPDSASQWAAANPNDPYAAVLRAQGV